METNSFAHDLGVIVLAWTGGACVLYAARRPIVAGLLRIRDRVARWDDGRVQHRADCAATEARARLVAALSREEAR